MNKKNIVFILILFSLISLSNAQKYIYENGEQYISIDYVLEQKTLNTLIDEITTNLFLNDSQNITTIYIEKEDINKSYYLNFITTDYAVQNNINTENNTINYDGVFYAEYNNLSNQIYIAIDKVLDSSLDLYSYRRKLITNILLHELVHYYQYNYNNFFLNMVDIFKMQGVLNDEDKYYYNLYNAQNYTYWDISDIPFYLQDSVNMSKVYSFYESKNYAKEIQARLIAVCYKDKNDWSKYWEMVTTTNYNICNQYNLPPYLQTQIAKDYELILINYYGADKLNLPELEKDLPKFFQIMKSLVKGFVDIMLKILPFFVIGFLIVFLIGFIQIIGEIFKNIFKKK